MPLLQDILKWTEGLPIWQRHAARCLFEKENGLSSDDYAELYQLFKASHGFLCSTTIVPVPLAASHLPVNAAKGKPIVLKAMRDLINVNRIAPDQKLTFATTGMTIIYGPNSSGKSGYSRVLKRACRARDQREEVLPDASDASARGKIPEATFDLDVDGKTKTLVWKANAEPPEDLSVIDVFDSYCARAYLTSELEVAYLPYGLDVVENLANAVLPAMERMLTAEIAAVNVDRQPFAHLLDETVVGQTIANLSDKTTPASIKTLATLSKDEDKRVTVIVSALAEPDPIAKAKIARLAAERMKNLADRIHRCETWCSDAAIIRLKELHDTAAAAAQAEKNAAIAFRAGENLLPGTGDPIWKTMFEAAQRFSMEDAYPQHSFPHTDDGALCPLCQQVLADGGERLQRFSKFIKDDIAKTAATERLKLQTAKGKIANAILDFGFDQALTKEINQLQPDLVKDIEQFQDLLLKRRNWMLNSLDTHDWETVPAGILNPRRSIRVLAAHSLRSARTLEKASNELKRASLKKELLELQARINLSKHLDAILSLLERLRLVKKLDACRKDLKTRPISDQSKVFASSAVTQTLRNALNSEFTALGIGHVQATLRDRNSKGKTLFQLVLNLPVAARLDAVLSEGEQRAIALGSFLAELSLAGHTAAIVFDDPVSSLDHHRRQNVAKRLVQEAKARQVIVFTHDTSFLGQLRDEIDQSGVHYEIHYLEWIGNHAGKIVSGLPWGHKSYKDRLLVLKSNQNAIQKKLWPTYPNEEQSAEMRQQYDLLRATIERVIQDVVFNGVVQRYRDWIRVNRLEAAVGFAEAEYLEIARLYQKCNSTVTAHDPSSAKNQSVPTAAELATDIADLEKVIDAIIHRREMANNKRKSPPAKP